MGFLRVQVGGVFESEGYGVWFVALHQGQAGLVALGAIVGSEQCFSRNPVEGERVRLIACAPFFDQSGAARCPVEADA